MKKQHFLTIVAKWMVVAVCVSLISVTTTWVIVNWHVQQVFQAFPMLSDWTQASAVQEQSEQIELSEEAADLREQTEEDLHVTEESESRLEGLVYQWLAKENETAEMDEDDESIPAWSQQGERAVLLSLDDLIRMQNQLSDEDRMQLFSLVGTKIPIHELQTLSEWMENGLTMEEIILIEEMAENHLTAQEVEQLFQIAEKYLE